MQKFTVRVAHSHICPIQGRVKAFKEMWDRNTQCPTAGIVVTAICTDQTDTAPFQVTLMLAAVGRQVTTSAPPVFSLAVSHSSL